MVEQDGCIAVCFKLVYTLQAQFVNSSIDSAISIGIGQAKMHDAKKVKQQIHNQAVADSDSGRSVERGLFFA